MLFLTQTTISVPALMGAIMCIGVATANSILMITFANDQRREGLDARAAALAAGSTRLRPVMMTALAMIVGMLPMSLGLGEGGEQNAPLGRAVIGGLLVATFFTLVFVPVLYTLLRRKPPATDELEDDLFESAFRRVGIASFSERSAARGRERAPGFPGGTMMSELLTPDRVDSERNRQPMSGHLESCAASAGLVVAVRDRHPGRRGPGRGAGRRRLAEAPS